VEVVRGGGGQGGGQQGHRIDRECQAGGDGGRSDHRNERKTKLHATPTENLSH
jgi:hypothetical protein